MLRLFRTIKSELNIRYISIIILLCLTAISYHPRFANFVIYEGGENPLNRYFYLMTVICFGLHFSIKRWVVNEFIRTSGIWVIINVVFLAFLFFIGGSSQYISDLMSIIMALSFLLIGYNSRLTKNQLMLLVFIYSIVVAISTAFQIIVNIGGFRIADLYMQYGKNTLGLMTASSAISTLFVTLESEKYLKKYGYMLFILLLFLTITIRARAAFLTIFAVSTLLLYRKNKTSHKKIFTTKFYLVIGLFVFLLILISPNIFLKIGNYIYDSFTQNQGSDLTSDRATRNAVALKILTQHPLLGNIEGKQHYALVHNYLLRVLSSYGLLFSFPIICLYLLIVKTIFQYTIKNIPVINHLGFWVMTVPLIISLAEPTFPFAPGTGIIFPFILFGCSLWMCNKPDNL